MKTRILLSCLLILLFTQLTKAQPKPPEPTLRMRLQKYVSDNRLYPGGTYIYFDTVSKKPYRFSPKDFIVEDISQPPVVLSVLHPAGSTTNGVVGGGNFHLVKDVDSLTDANIANKDYNSYIATSAPFTVLNYVSYFSADDGIHGAELWRSDGTAAGTYLVKDVVPGLASSSPYNITTSGSVVFFNYKSNDYSSIAELWKTDGTEAGTVKVTDLANPYNGFSPVRMCDVDGILYIALNISYQDNEIWKSDGTAEGTVLVKNLGQAIGGSIGYLAAANGLLFFAFEGYGGLSLWRSDGTDTGTFRLQNIDSMSYHNIQQFTAYYNKLYFSGTGKTNTNALWVSDGTIEGTSIVSGNNNMNLAYNDFYPFTISDSILYCFGNTGTSDLELYKYDIADTAAGLQLVTDIVPGKPFLFGIPTPGSVAVIDSSIYFSYFDTAYHWHLDKTNGIADSTTELKKFGTNVYPSKLYNLNGKLYFSGSDSASGYEPWVSDGTTEGTVMLEDIFSGTAGSKPNNFTALNGKVIFAGTSDRYGNEIFVSNGNGAQLVKEINTTTTSSSYVSYVFNTVPFKDSVLTNAYTYDKGYELWKGNSTDESFVKDVNAGQDNSNSRNFLVKGNVAYFIIDSSDVNYRSTGGSAIYKTDGTPEGTVKMTTGNPGSIYWFTVTDDGTIFYMAGFYSFWKTDGTEAGTLFLHGFSDITYRGEFKSIGNTVYFNASEPGSYINNELWKSDGTVAGTVIVKDIYPGSQGSDPGSLYVLNNQLLFSANDGTGSAFWKSDGTNAGTVKVSNVSPAFFTPTNSDLLFSGYQTATGSELWKTDGTTEGTMLVKDIYTGAGNSYPYSLTDVNGTLYFQANDSIHGIELWKSDGTAEGTILVKDITPGSGASDLTYFTSSAGKLFFIKDYNKIWTSDGTVEGTGVVANEELNDVYASALIANGNQLFFDGYTHKYGYELWTGDATQAVLPVSLLSFTASLKNTDVITQWQTATEVNTSYFNVQRSTDATHFTTAGTVTAKGNSNNMQSYSFPDVNIANLISAKTIYYRLQTVDKDGRTSYSKIVPVTLNSKEAIVLLRPNPVKDLLKIQVNYYAGKITIDLYDLSGKKLTTSQQTVQSGSEININTSSLQAGVYVVKVNLNGKISQQKFIKE